MRLLLPLIGYAAAVAVVAGLAVAAPTGTTATASPTGATAGASDASAASAARTLTVRSSAYGRILFDGRGRALYAFTRDRNRATTCFGACATAWPPYVVSGPLRAGAGTSGAKLGTIRRPDGTRQVTYDGRPLYYYVGDRRPGQVTCQNVFEFGGLWLVVRPNGSLVR